ncbi:MAG TPA: DUF711 family protein [Roseiflexaceae bacterium]|nr:DUF711 family protein [Roseiflexaceae bacterium]
MEIRTITAGAREADIERVARAARLARERLESAGYVVQTLRLALAMSGSNRCADFATVAQGAEQQAIDAGFDCVSIGRVDVERLGRLAEGIAATQALFASARIAGRDGIADRAAIRAAAEAIVAIGAATKHGSGNLRFAASACVAPGSPFFPAAYHHGDAPWIAVGPEAAALAVEAITDHRPPTTDYDRDDSLVVGRRSPALSDGSPERSRRVEGSVVGSILERMTNLIERHDAQIGTALKDVEAETGIFFAGCDWSLAPHPDPARSIGAAIEGLSGAPFGAWGTLAAVRGLTGAIRAARVTQLGFSGVMLPVLEDSILARRNAEGRYTLRDLLAFSAVCGAGLDTIPLPGDTSPEQIARVLEELAALAGALRKPLTARLLPLPGLKAGDLTDFDRAGDPQLAEYFCTTRVMRIE